MRYMVEMVRPWWRFWRSDRMFKDQADHEWTTWKISALQGNSQMLEKILEMFFLQLEFMLPCIQRFHGSPRPS